MFEPPAPVFGPEHVLASLAVRDEPPNRVEPGPRGDRAPENGAANVLLALNLGISGNNVDPGPAAGPGSTDWGWSRSFVEPKAAGGEAVWRMIFT
jgi:hypothetical protein